MITPQQIAAMIPERRLMPGELGINESVIHEQGQEKEVEPGDMNIVKEMAIRISENTEKLIKAAEIGNVQAARAILADINGEVKQAFIHTNRLAIEKGLVEPEHRNDT